MKNITFFYIAILLIAASCNSKGQIREEKIYYDNGKLRRINKYVGDSLKEAYFFYKDGDIQGKVVFYQGFNEHILYYPDMTISGKVKTINNKFEGKCYFYYQNGTISAEENFKNGKQDGEQIYYNEDGTIEKKQYYDNGKLIREEKPK